jgi:2-hydroxychromene-2-carboxylate isomerase
MHTLEFFFDCSSPWTYLAFESVQKLKARVDFDIVWRPILVGGVFNQVNPSVYENRANPVPVKARYYQKDLQDWAHYVGITIGQPPVFPVNSVKAMRGAFVALEHGVLPAYARAVFETYWGDLADISQDDVLSGIDTSRHAPSGRRVLRKIKVTTYKDRLRINTEEVMNRGGFGSPTMFLDSNGMIYNGFGNDRFAAHRTKLAQ